MSNPNLGNDIHIIDYTELLCIRISESTTGSRKLSGTFRTNTSMSRTCVHSSVTVFISLIIQRSTVARRETGLMPTNELAFATIIVNDVAQAKAIPSTAHAVIQQNSDNDLHIHLFVFKFSVDWLIHSDASGKPRKSNAHIFAPVVINDLGIWSIYFVSNPFLIIFQAVFWSDILHI